jgi:hypothetical protein
VVVYLQEPMWSPAEEAVASTTYLLVQIARWNIAPSERAAWIGHELQHSLEIAAAPDVTDAVGLARLYEHLGWEGLPGRFESGLAKATGDRVRIELSGAPE